ncbi:MAG TPA: PmoA family protein [Pirellulales bacterium]
MSRLGMWMLVAAALLAAPFHQAQGADEFGLTVRDSSFDVTLNGQPFTSLHNDLGPKPILFPIIGPTSKPLTRSYPMEDVAGETKDHPHHRSLWFTHGDVNGVDFWAEKEGNGKIEHEAFTEITRGHALAITEACRWVAADKTVHVQDVRTYGFALAPDGSRIIDFDITLKAPAEKPVKFGDTKEGTFGVRVPSVLDVDKKLGGKITNDKGETDAKAWGQPAAWVDYSGVIDGEKVGITIMNHPTSFRYPTTWHVRTYGLFAANPFGLGSFPSKLKEDGSVTLAPGKSLTLRYRVLLHKGDATDAKLAEAFKAYSQVEKPKVEQPE